MVKRLLFLIPAVAAFLAVKGDGNAQAVLTKLSDAVRGLGGYSVSFELNTGDYNATGRYVVSGDAYYMNIGNAEVYSDGKVRREVNGDKREVIIDAVDLSGRNILNNPTRAFDFIGSQYEGTVESSSADKITVRLRPKSNSRALGDVVVTVDAVKYLPQSVVYEIERDRIKIDIKSIRSEKEPPRKFDQSSYKGYEFIDFR